MTRSESKDLRKLVGAQIARKLDAGKLVNREQLIDEMMRGFKVEGSDADLALTCIRFTLTEMFKREAQKYTDSEASANAQVLLPGYEHLQVAYSITRDDAQFICPLDKMTDDEIDVKAAEHQQQSRGHAAHAKELLAYKMKRARSRE